MNVYTIVAATLVSAATAHPSLLPRQDDNAYILPTSSDRPCPMLNTMANHGFLPRNGLTISMDVLAAGMKGGVNLAEDATRLVGVKALIASTIGGPNTFNLDDVNKQGVIGHDGSLSRNDIFGDNHSFNQTIWNSTASHFTESTISITTTAAARKARLAEAAAANPEFSMTAGDAQNSIIESALYLSVFANGPRVMRLWNGSSSISTKMNLREVKNWMWVNWCLSTRMPMSG
ncbi:Cloroperoxidase [Zopfia rhizophila CBS 207.26]|uniref:Cloroperoxidase n=1 Tax=Zopfia rhizophila CBS 207.26 TaxID=1314779 RepID=A0A6A6EG88_9PEZI|nr:Cloroperoxidase [Zopfia rhizophila CBS 207.26]